MKGNGHEKRVNLIEEIGCIKHGRYHVNTDKLRATIDKFGINYRDDYKGKCLLDLADYMDNEQIDILFEHRVTPYEDDNNEYIRYFFLFGVEKHIVYILQKLLEQDDEFLFITKKMRLLSDIYGKFGTIYLIDFLRVDRKVNFISRYKCDKMIAMLQNHQKKYRSLFDLLKHHIE